MLISAIIPTFNRAGFLPEAIASVRAQTLPAGVDMEVIVVDDASTDNTAEVIVALGSDIRCIRLAQNRGAAGARNAGVRAAQGELIAFLDSDDLWMPNKLQTQCALMQAHAGCELVWGRAQVESLEPDDARYAMIYHEPLTTVLVGAVLFRRHLFEPGSIGLFDERLHIVEDFDWFNRAREKPVNMVLHDDAVLRYRKHSDSLTGTFQNFALERREMLGLLKISLERRRQQPRDDLNMAPLTPRNGQASVIIPAHNAARYLAQAIDSVLAQTRPALEIIVVDDGSTDGTAAVAQRYGAAVKLLRQAQAGVAAARNRGVSAAVGNMLAFLDADDLWLPHKLSLQMRMLEARPGLDMVFCHAEQFVSADAQRAQEGIPASLRVLPAICAGGLLIWRKTFERVGAFDAGYIRAEMLDWFARAQDAGARQYVIPEVLMRRRWHDTNLGVTERANNTVFTSAIKAALDRRRAANPSS